MNISAHIQFFKQEMQRRNYASTTIKSYSNSIEVFFAQSKSDHPKNIHEKEIREYLNLFKEPNTQRSIHGAIKKYYDICLNQKNKFKYIPYCRPSKKLPIVLSVSEIQSMFDVCENTKHKLILAILYSCGIRVSELINLKWCDIDRKRMVINIIQGKGNKDRIVPLLQQLIPLLITYYREYKSSVYVLNGQFGLQYSERSVLQVMKQLAEKAGIDKRVYSHLIRHCCFTHLLEQGIDLSIIQKIAGHNNIKTTQSYTHISHNLISRVQSPFAAITI